MLFRSKARTIFDMIRQDASLAKYMDSPVIADDSGLMVDEMGGAPGVYSARYAGEGCTYDDNNVKMLGEDVDVGPITNETCPECGHDKATYKLLQTRSADEAPTRIFTCAKCKHTWRAYD